MHKPSPFLLNASVNLLPALQPHNGTIPRDPTHTPALFTTLAGCRKLEAQWLYAKQRAQTHTHPGRPALSPSPGSCARSSWPCADRSGRARTSRPTRSPAGGPQREDARSPPSPSPRCARRCRLSRHVARGPGRLRSRCRCCRAATRSVRAKFERREP